MRATAEILGKEIMVEWSATADKAMGSLAAPLQVEMELYFSCLIRKAVRFGHASPSPYSVLVTPQLNLNFRPIVTKACKVSEVEDEPPVEDFKLAKPEAFVPKRIVIDFKRGEWVGEFFM